MFRKALRIRSAPKARLAILNFSRIPEETIKLKLENDGMQRIKVVPLCIRTEKHLEHVLSNCKTDFGVANGRRL
jgi:hypothetical protein